MMRIGRQLSIQRRGAEAQTLFRQAIERAPSNADARQLLVDALVSESKYSDVAKEMSQLVDLEPDNIDRLVRWGELIISNEAVDVSERRKQASLVWQSMLTKRGNDAVTVARVADLVRGAELPRSIAGPMGVVRSGNDQSLNCVQLTNSWRRYAKSLTCSPNVITRCKIA